MSRAQVRDLRSLTRGLRPMTPVFIKFSMSRAQVRNLRSLTRGLRPMPSVNQRRYCASPMRRYLPSVARLMLYAHIPPNMPPRRHSTIVVTKLAAVWSSCRFTARETSSMIPKYRSPTRIPQRNFLFFIIFPLKNPPAKQDKI